MKDEIQHQSLCEDLLLIGLCQHCVQYMFLTPRLAVVIMELAETKETPPVHPLLQ